jgi:hypothetical protein
MNACQKLVAAEIFADRYVEEVQVQCLELVGKKCHDLIMMNNQKPSIVEIRDNPDGSESIEINASLYALKECIRIRLQNSKTTKKHIHVPYRSSNLTRILRESLECPDARLHVIATVSPNATNTEHTIHTLKTISTLTGSSLEERDSHQWISTWRDQPGTDSPRLKKAPKKMSHLELVQWLAQRHLLGKSNVPEHIDAKSVMNMSKIQLKYLFCDDASSLSGDEKAGLLFKSLHSETEKVAKDEYKRRMQHVNSQ